MGRYLYLIFCIFSISLANIAFAEEEQKVESKEDSTEPEQQEESEKKEKIELEPGWRCDPTIKRHPGSYIAVGLGYNQGRAWFNPIEDEFSDDVSVGPVHARQTSIRVGDAFFEWFAVGFQIDIVRTFTADTNSTMSAFGLLLDTTFYPFVGPTWRGLGIRPSIGLGFAYAVGEYDFESGFGGPFDLALAFTYEFRLGRLWALSPVAQVNWIRSDDFDSLFLTFGIEIAKWFDTPTG